MNIEILVSGITCFILGLISGYILHHWLFDEQLREVEQCLTDLEDKYYHRKKTHKEN